VAGKSIALTKKEDAKRKEETEIKHMVLLAGPPHFSGSRRSMRTDI
jgi:hypothetical protein